MDYEEKVERIELIDAASDAGRLARGLDQLLESLAHANQLDPLDVEGILALRSISERCAESHRGTPRASWRRRTRSFMPRGKSRFSTLPVERERSALGGEAVALLVPPPRFRQAPGIGAPLISLAR